MELVKPKVRPASSGTASVMGTASRSWKMRMPRLTRPWGASISARSWSVVSTMAVLDRAASMPSRTLEPPEKCSAKSGSAKKKAQVRSICDVPP